MTNQTALDKARAALEAVEAELAALQATKSEAARDRASFDEWRAKSAAATAEHERLIALIETLKQEAAADDALEAEAALRRRYAVKVTANAKLATRIKSDVAKANAIMLGLVRDVWESAAEDVEINAALPDDLEPLVPADFIARGRPGLERQELKRTRVWLWVNSRGGGLIGDQDVVTDHGDGRGRIGQGPYTVICTHALFDQAEYHPAESAERPEALWQMRLPRPDGPGFAFDGTRCNYPSDALAEIALRARAQEPRKRPTEVELRPVPSVAVNEEAA
ncbi:hypothetical protein MA20_30985 [Bradyrhizobium japonicum]|uniref:Uncharacterized protein n=2 Tax=Bradyrhizobium japonicum TaxID=375 RepID=A0A0A3XMM2_BRAJP|nr:hypothetical protein [Bradyrhizobium japonicum]KGT75647.1 hypothetical protein MA20_30985 [Bradyrhizobium japonicum]MCS3895234.1 hypothetical protein [Bradyrhizobium japonicum USDA 38]MCS3947749.1 hypothetical protein [Bradyrhizobium japonicum]